MSNVETVGTSRRLSDPLLRKQREDVAKMRTSLLVCSDDPSSAAAAMRNITILRVYHQVARIIRYLEMMDKIEEKLYDAIDVRLETLDVNNPAAWMQLFTIQEKMQDLMISSHKLLQPYLNVQEFNLADLTVSVESANESHEAELLPRESRDKIRMNAQQLLQVLDAEVVEGEIVDDQL